VKFSLSLVHIPFSSTLSPVTERSRSQPDELSIYLFDVSSLCLCLFNESWKLSAL